MRPFKRHSFTDLNSEKNTITIVPYTVMGSIRFNSWIQLKSENQTAYTCLIQKENLSFFFIAIYIVVGLYHILLAYKRRKDLYNFYFGIFCILVSIQFFIANTFLEMQSFKTPLNSKEKLEHVFMFAMTRDY